MSVNETEKVNLKVVVPLEPADHSLPVPIELPKEVSQTPSGIAPLDKKYQPDPTAGLQGRLNLFSSRLDPGIRKLIAQVASTDVSSLDRGPMVTKMEGYLTGKNTDFLNSPEFQALPKEKQDFILGLVEDAMFWIDLEKKPNSSDGFKFLAASYGLEQAQQEANVKGLTGKDREKFLRPHQDLYTMYNPYSGNAS